MRQGKYATEEAAFKRVDSLKDKGVWPGTRVYDDDSADVLYDPDPDIITRSRKEDD